MLKATRSLLLAAIAVLALGTTTSAQDKTELRVLRLGASADVLVNSGMVFTSLEGASDNAIVEPGEARIEMYSSGENDYPFLDSRLELFPGKSYSLLPVTGPEGEDMEPFLVTDDRTPPAAGTVHVPALHGSPGAPVFDVAIKDGPVLPSGIEYMEAADFTPVDAGTYD
jgi:hypothetical protein